MKNYVKPLLIVISIVLAFWACGGDDDDKGNPVSGAQLLADELADRLLDSLDFDGGQPMDEPMPEGSSSGPGIASAEFPSVPPAQSPQFTITFTIDESAELETVTRTVVGAKKDGTPANKHILVTHELDPEMRMVTLSGNISEDEDIAGESFDLLFALQTTDGLTGMYESWSITAPEVSGEGDVAGEFPENDCEALIEDAKAQYAEYVDDPCFQACANEYYDCIESVDCDYDRAMDECYPSFLECVTECGTA